MAKLDPHRDDSTDSEIRDMLEECLQAMETEGKSAVDRFCAQHPSHAKALLRRIKILDQLGMLPGVQNTQQTIPERIGGFRLIRKLGSGGMGVVYLAEQESLGRRVALKVVRPELMHFDRARERFQREVQTVAALQHPGIAPIFEVGEDQGVPFFAMEFIEGRSLGQVLVRLEGQDPTRLQGLDLWKQVTASEADEDEPTGSDSVSVPAARDLPELFRGQWVEACLKVAQRAAATLAFAQDHGVVHRDIKPSNIMVTPDGRVLLVDFGLAIRGGVPRMTRTGSEIGSLAYMSPEQILGESRDATPASDVYSLGVTLYEMLTLHSPFQSDSSETTRRRVVHGDARAPRAVNPSVPRDVETVCGTAMTVEPQRRYRTAGALERDLRNLLEFRPIEARRPGTVLRMRRHVQRHPVRSLAALLAFVVVVVGPLSLWWVQTQANRRLEIARDELRDALTDLVQLSDLKRLQDLRAAAGELYPVDPELIPDMTAWLEEARTLGATLASHRASLAELEEKVELIQSGAGSSDYFAIGDLEWWHATLNGLVNELTDFTNNDPAVGHIADMRRRLKQAEGVGPVSLVDAEADWEEAVFFLADSETYGGLEITPQIGLVPLGPDPETGYWEFWHVLSGTKPERDPDTERLVITAETGIVLVLFPGATFTMGAQRADEAGENYDPGALAGEVPHPVTLDPFFLSKYEMTQGQWERLTYQRPSYFGHKWFEDAAIAGTHPVELVNWDDCDTTLRRVNLLLPTEAQWEYAARAGTDTPWWTGSTKESLADTTNLAEKSFVAFYQVPLAWEDWTDGHAHHAAVGTLPANPFGLHEILGNVSEWCADWYAEYELGVRPGDGLRLPGKEPATTRIMRGGAYRSIATGLRTTNRNHLTPGSDADALGVRPARPVHD